MYIHISGQANLIDFGYPLGKAQEGIYGDIEDEAEILSHSLHNIHAAIKQKIISRAETLGIRAAIMSSPLVYGQSRGPTPQNQYFKFYTNVVIQNGRTFVVGSGEKFYGHSHASNVASTLETIVMEVLKGDTGRATWDKHGYYFVESIEAPFLEDANAVAEVLSTSGLIKTADIDNLDGRVVDAM